MLHDSAWQTQKTTLIPVVRVNRMIMQLLAVSLVSDRILPPIPCAQALDVDGSGAARWVFIRSVVTCQQLALHTNPCAFLAWMHSFLEVLQRCFPLATPAELKIMHR